MEIEYASNSTGKSYVGRFATSSNPEDNDLAWAWVRAMKNKKPVKELSGLGIWNRERETKEDVYWYLCTRPAKATGTSTAPASALGPLATVDAISVRATEKLTNLEELRAKSCVEKPSQEPYPLIVGPYPSENMARAAAQEKAAAHPVADPAARTAVVLKRRVLL
jgi:hypothetical protein